MIAPLPVSFPELLMNGMLSSTILLAAVLSANGMFSAFQSGCDRIGQLLCAIAGCSAVLCWNGVPHPLQGGSEKFCDSLAFITRIASSVGPYPPSESGPLALVCRPRLAPPIFAVVSDAFPWNASMAETAFLILVK